MTTRIRYGIFARQIVTMVIPACLLPVIIIGLLLLGFSPWLVAAAIIAWAGLIVWLIVRHINGDGDVTLDDDGLTIEPRRYAFCAARGRVRIAWAQVADIQEGATQATPPRGYVILKIRRPRRRSWILTENKETAPGFSVDLLARANAARAQQGEVPLEFGDPFDSTLWRVIAVSGLVVFLGGIIAAFATGRAGEISVWARICGVGAFAIPLTQLSFRSKRKRS